ncbi:hypothetical protein PAHAL_9G557300 [Panicum hallii]|uniref:Uncharacterized protein n=1 Tax=Panicum hallii TaxID=206008 RepID=A0A2T8I5W7_9POAL|nr:hypothetical protein PAHAL_9G557300 [Panicum hallii]
MHRPCTSLISTPMSQVPFTCQLGASTNAGWFAGQPELLQALQLGKKNCRCRNPRPVFFLSPPLNNHRILTR